jgi:hypothetical protein
MDPTQALIALLVNITREDRDGTLDSLEALAGWIHHKGFFPRVREGVPSEITGRVRTFTVEVRSS